MPKVDHFAFPGGYPLFYFVRSDDGEFHSCPSCVNQHRVGKNAKLSGYINWEDESLTCEVCEKTLEPAYS
jgi:hypothetical protein